MLLTAHIRKSVWGNLMRYTYFGIDDYKGIREARLNLDPALGIYTLVGLNESGKTTILEAINSIAASESTDPSGTSVVGDPRDLIPLRNSADFTGTIRVVAGIELDDSDQRAIAARVPSTSRTKIKVANSCTVGRYIEFKRGVLVKEWNPHVTLEIDRGTARKKQTISINEKASAYQEVIERLPRILYFPNFLVDLPGRIYIDPKVSLPSGTARLHGYYRSLIEDIFRSEDLNLETDVLDRMAEDSDERTKRQLEASLRRVEANMTRVIIDGWKEILKREDGPGKVVVKYGEDDVGKYLQFRIAKNVDEYQISERSLGFRWYFAYVLLTHYRLSRHEEQGIIYLFDEPASNLHSAAQQRLLSSLSDLRKRGGTVIYTTHSLHMINPEWLEGAYVVRNTGLSYDNDGAEYTPDATNIELLRYRDYVSQGPSNMTHIQPILDALDYRPSQIELRRDAILVEGKNDYYTLTYLARLLGVDNLYFIPGTGASTLDSVVRLYVGWQWPFVVLHDSDEMGLAQHWRMREAFDMVPEARFALLNDVADNPKVKGIESLISVEDRLAIQATAGKASDKYNKKQFNNAVRELLATGKTVDLSNDTKERLIVLITKLRERME